MKGPRGPAKKAARLLLLEFFPAVLRRNEGSMLFPFLQGLAREHGVRTDWLCFGERERLMRPGAETWTSSVGLGGSTARSLGESLASFRPTHILSSDRLDGELRELVEGVAPRPALVVMPALSHGRPDHPEKGEDDETLSFDPRSRRHYAKCAWFLDWMGLSDPAREGEYLVEAAAPDYAARTADGAARRLRPLLSIAGGVLCGNRRRLRDNPIFRPVLTPPTGERPSAEGHLGCSFCGSNRASLTSRGADVASLVERQFRGILATAGGGGRDKGLYEFYDIRAFWKFDEVFDVVLRLKVPPSIFLFNPRIDDVLRARERISRTLPALARAGHEVRVLSMGIENFSESENARFNKGITVAQVDEFLALAGSWTRAYPSVFKPFKDGADGVELGFILFTPWTTLGDLRVNLEHARARGFNAKGYWLYSTLSIKPYGPLFLLAEKDGGILGDRFPDKGQLFGVFKNGGDSSSVVGWRFREPDVADFFAVLVRVCAVDRGGDSSVFFAGDPLFESASKRSSEANARVSTPPLAVAFALLEMLETPSRPRRREELLREAFRRALETSLLAAPAALKAPAGSAPRSAHPLDPLEKIAIDEVARLLKSGAAKGFSGLSIEGAGATSPDRRSIRLDLLADGRALAVALFAADYPGPFFFETGRYKAIYLKEGEERGARELGELSVRLRPLIVLIERRLEALRAR